MPLRTSPAILLVTAVATVGMATGCRSSRGCQTCSPDAVSYHEGGAPIATPAPQPDSQVPHHGGGRPPMPQNSVPPAPGVGGPQFRSSQAPPVPHQAQRMAPGAYGSSRTVVAVPSVFDKLKSGFRRLASFRFGRRRAVETPMPIESGMTPQPDPYFQPGGTNSRPVGFGSGRSTSTAAPVQRLPQTSAQTQVQPQLQRVPESEIDVEAWPYTKGESRQPIALQAENGIVPQNFQPAVHGLPEQSARQERLTLRLPGPERRSVGFQSAQLDGPGAAPVRQRPRLPRQYRGSAGYRSVSHGHTAPPRSYGQPLPGPSPVPPTAAPPQIAPQHESEFPETPVSETPISERPIQSRNFR